MKIARFYITPFLVTMLMVQTTMGQSGTRTPESTEAWEPKPKVVTPGEKLGTAPSDAVKLLDGNSLNEWLATDGTIAKWNLTDGVLTVKPGAGDIKTKKEFGDFQLHLEWRSPSTVDTTQKGQGRGNSGVFLQDLYEVQILDSYNNITYPNGQAASIYKQHTPLVNASKPPGEWQTYDIVFIAPRFNDDGRVMIPARVTVIHNGVLVQNNVALLGPTEYLGLPVYRQHGKGSIRLQDHGNPVSFRNIWIREL